MIGTGDCLHPEWMKELKTRLEPAEPGLFKLKSAYERDVKRRLPAACQGEVRFLLSTEISSIYKKDNKVRKVHNVLFFPSFEIADNVFKRLDRIGNLHSDGRPILGLDARDLLEIVLEADASNVLVPAHIWTPWFSVLGSKSGFDSIEECFEDLTTCIFALETGLSSDPLMNWRLSKLDAFVMMSNSDAHSAPNLGRESTMFDTDLSYPAMMDAMRNNSKGLAGTVEFFPEEGKYHYDGHRACHCRLHPKETIVHKGVCPVCGQGVTVGVMTRVEELADHPEGRKSPRGRPYYSLIPLPEIIGAARGMGVGSKSVQETYETALRELGPEMKILMELPIEAIGEVTGGLIAEGVNRVRQGKVSIAAGYDGEYGTINIFSEQERQGSKGQMTLF
ncbi:MAG: endonuclease Q family protein [Candidatus Omnitrophota bacterium]